MLCIAPNVCVCKNSQYKNVNGSCEPKCEFGEDRSDCLNAKCVGPNECECLTGYDKVSESTCEPVCEKCDYGDCIGPELCECHEGYDNVVLSDGSEDKSECQPICEVECINAQCVSPNFCECRDKSFKRISDNECAYVDDSKCNDKNCQNGLCVDGECVCKAQHKLIDGKCKKMCDMICEHGKCLDDKCFCDDGYKVSEDRKRCDPVCAFEDGHDCEFDFFFINETCLFEFSLIHSGIEGICIAPQTCQCNPGFKFLGESD